jgi:hypothetical protein
LQQHRERARTQPSLGQQFDEQRTGLVVVEAMPKRMAEPIQAEMPAATNIGLVQKRAIVRMIFHVSPASARH